MKTIPKGVLKQIFMAGRERLGLMHWHIDVEVSDNSVAPDGREISGYCELVPETRKAIITLVPEHIENIDELERVIKHELLHIVTADVAGLFENIINNFVKGSNEKKFLADQFTLTIEKVVASLSLSLTPFRDKNDTTNVKTGKQKKTKKSTKSIG